MAQTYSRYKPIKINIRELWNRNNGNKETRLTIDEIINILPKKYDDKKLGSTDLTQREMFERGFNSCVAQIKNKIKTFKQIKQ